MRYLFATFCLTVSYGVSAQNLASSLMQAAWSGQAAAVRSALASGRVDVDVENNDGTTPLFMASLAGHEAVVDILVAASADVNKASAEGETPMIVASKYGFTAVAIQLIEAGGDVNAEDVSGRTAWTWAHWGENEELKRLLKASGSDGSGEVDPFENGAPVDRFEKNPVLRKVGKIKMPKALKDEVVRGTVRIRMIVDRDGRPGSFELLEGIHDELDANALKSAAKWRFHPGEIQGRKVVGQVVAAVEYDPADQEGNVMIWTTRWRN